MAGETIFIVEDDGVIALRMQEMLTKAGYVVPDPVAFGEDAIEQIAQDRAGLVLMDIELMGEIDGIETARTIQERYEIPVIYLTAYVDDHRLARAKETAPYGYIVKPFMDRELLATIDMALHRHALDRKLKESEQRYHAVIDKAAEGIVIFDSDTKLIRDANPAFIKLTGYSRDDIGTLTLADLLDGTPEKVRAEVDRISSDQGFIGEGQIRCRDATLRDVEIASSRISLKGGNAVTSLVAHDITERKRAGEALTQVNRKLHFLSQITRHDLANSLTVAIGYNGFMNDLVTDPKAREFLAKQELILNGMNRQIQFTRLYEDVGSQAPCWLRLSPTISAGAAQFDPALFSRSPEESRFEIYADSLFEKVFYNLFENAVRHGTGLTKISTMVRESETGLTITVMDNGAGIAPGIRDKIFNRGFGSNTGLGLYLCKEILDITRIAIRETGTPGSGARFEIIVPKGAYRVS